MRRRRAFLTVSGLLTGSLVVGAGSTADAAVTATASGTTVTVAMSGVTEVAFTCSGGTARVNGLSTSPTVPCSTLSKVVVSGDAATQRIDGRGLDASSFTAKPHIEVAASGSQDFVWDTAQADILATGPGNDFITIQRRTVNTSVLGGTDSDTLEFVGTKADESITLTSASGTTLTITDTDDATTVVHTAQEVEKVRVLAGDGADFVSASGIALASAIDTVFLEGEGGADVLAAGAGGAYLDGGPGRSTFTGGAGNDTAESSSEDDLISLGLGANSVYDVGSLHVGRPGLANTGAANRYNVANSTGDAVIRVRDDVATGGIRFTASLDRTGQGLVPGTFATFAARLDTEGGRNDRGLGDLVASTGGRELEFAGDQADDDLLDITVPSGSWTVTGTANTSAIVDPASAAYGSVYVANVGSLRVHGPWPNADQSFAHRVVRDLLFRFLGDADRTSTAAQLAGGTTTRPAIVALLMGNDEYRGLDVDRTFAKYLRRTADPGGRTYWINSIRNGKALWRFRAQLFGSNEYFTKAGGTNANYVQKAYADVLGRDPDPSGKTYWTNKLNAGADRGSVALQFLNSPEARRRLVDDQFLRFLDRKPTAGEQTTWVNALPGTTGEQDLIAFLVTTSAYYNRT